MEYSEVESVGSVFSSCSTGDHTDTNTMDVRARAQPTSTSAYQQAQEEISTIDQEVLIQKERITVIMDAVVRKSKLAIALPRLVQEFVDLERVLAPKELQEFMLIYEQYLTLDKCHSAHLVNAQAIEEIKVGDISMRNRISPELASLIQILSKHPSLYDSADTIIQKEMASGESPVLSYLQTLQQLQQLVMRQINTSAADYFATKLGIKTLVAANEKLNTEICVIQTALKMEQQTFERRHLNETMILEDLDKQMHILEERNKCRLPKIILESERQMVLASRGHSLEMVVLKEQEAAWKETYSTILEKHLIEEKSLRARRLKTKTQLANWVQKYDLDMAEKQQELDDATIQNEMEAERVKELKEQLAAQDEDYEKLMAERNAEYEEEMERKMWIFLRDHSARVIQFAWLQVLENRREKQKRKRQTKRATVSSEDKG